MLDLYSWCIEDLFWRGLGGSFENHEQTLKQTGCALRTMYEE